MTDERLSEIERMTLDDETVNAGAPHFRQGLTELVAEVRRLRDELADLLVDTLVEHTSEEPDGWRCGNGRSESRYAGERLVELGKVEAHPDNTAGSRVNRYRLLRDRNP